jgi:hypothetical protein
MVQVSTKVNPYSNVMVMRDDRVHGANAIIFFRYQI